MTTPSRKEIEKAVEFGKELLLNNECYDDLNIKHDSNRCIESFIKLSESYLKVSGEMPDKIMIETERGFGCGCTACTEGCGECLGETVNDTIEKCTIVTTRLLTDRDARIKQLEQELEKYRIMEEDK